MSLALQKPWAFSRVTWSNMGLKLLFDNKHIFFMYASYKRFATVVA
jgi:hypothetical protein